MTCRGYLTFFWMFAVPTVLVTGDDCAYKDCSCDFVQILCQNKGLVTIQRDNNISDATQTRIFFDVNQIKSIPAGSLLPNLTELSLLNNPVRTIDNESFIESATTLETLTFSNAQFTRIPDALTYLKALLYFSLYDSHIQDWNTAALMNIGRTVLELSLGNVGFTTWPSWIQIFSNLTELSISDSIFSYIPPNAFNSVVHTLVKLSLNNNNLTSLPRAFSQLYRLQWLAVENTDVHDILWLPMSYNLTYLYLANNNISNADSVSTCLRPYAYSLQYVDLHGNKLTCVPELEYMINLHYLNISHNHMSLAYTGSLPTRINIVDLAFNYLPLIPHFLSGLEDILYLNLPQNAIQELRGENFPPATIVANFGFNLITNLTDTSFPEVSNITFLRLNNNPIVSISSSAFRNVVNLSFLNLQYTKLTRLPLALSSLTHLYSFDISGSADLVCTCAEKSLQPLIVGMPEVNGTCGDTTILYFFTNLTSGCDN